MSTIIMFIVAYFAMFIIGSKIVHFQMSIIMFMAVYLPMFILGSISSNLRAETKVQIHWSTTVQQVGQLFSTDDLTVFLRFWELQV